MAIRSAHASDLPYLYEICDRTGYRGGDASSVVAERALLGQYFAAPYVIRDPSWCWIAEDENGVVGYLVSTPDTAAFSRWMDEAWLPHLRTRKVPQPPLSEFDQWLRALIHETAGVPDLALEYPSHLHIDLVPRAQGRGLGSQLIARFRQKLHETQIPGFHLGVSEANTRALDFYRKQGFRTLETKPGVIYMGLSGSELSPTTKTPSSLPLNPAT